MKEYTLLGHPVNFVEVHYRTAEACRDVLGIALDTFVVTRNIPLPEGPRLMFRPPFHLGREAYAPWQSVIPDGYLPQAMDTAMEVVNAAYTSLAQATSGAEVIHELPRDYHAFEENSRSVLQLHAHYASTNQRMAIGSIRWHSKTLVKLTETAVDALGFLDQAYVSAISASSDRHTERQHSRWHSLLVHLRIGWSRTH